MISSLVPARSRALRAAGIACLAGLLCAATASCGARSSLVDGASAGADTGTAGGNAGTAGSGAGAAGAGGTTTTTTTTTSTTSTSTTTTSTSTTTTSTTTTGCSSDAECDDGVGCTIDHCGGLGCEHLANDAACDDGIGCTVDHCGGAGCEHVADSSFCNDGVLCTIDSCTLQGCTHSFSDAPCADAIVCTVDTCDAATDTCSHESCDSICDDNVFCNGVERCDTTLGCTEGPPACTLGLGCETSACSEATELCSHELQAGCVAPDVHLLVTDSFGKLWDVAPYATPPTSVVAASKGTTHLDIAILNGRWFAVDSHLVELAPGTNNVIGDLGPLPANSLGAGPDGKLYAASMAVFRIDPDTGMKQTVGVLPPGYSSSGDIAFLGDRMFVSTDGPCGGSLVEFDLDTGTGTVLGGDGLGCVYGLAGGPDELFILNCDGKVGAFDPDTGQARIFATTSIEVYGADRLK